LGRRERGTKPAVGAVVVTFTVNGPGVPALTFTLEADTVHVASEGAPAHDSATVPLNPADEFTCRLYVAVSPGVIGALAAWPDGALKQKSSAVPLSATLCGLPGALSLRSSVALLVVSVPHVAAGEGRNAISTVHVPPGAVLPVVQLLLVMSKSLPLTLTPLNTSGPAPDPVALFVTVIGWGGPSVCASWGEKLMLGTTETEADRVAEALPATGTARFCSALP